jgi:hypothetical protein
MAFPPFAISQNAVQKKEEREEQKSGQEYAKELGASPIISPIQFLLSASSSAGLCNLEWCKKK